MKKAYTFFLFFVLVSLTYFTFQQLVGNSRFISGAPPYGEPETAVPDSLDPFAWIRDWVRPDGPVTVALQVGHLNSNELPEELQKIRGNTGASAVGFTEVEVNEEIVVQTKERLEKEGIEVVILPATIPERFYADAFVAVHADGSENTTKSGYKSSPPWRDFSGKSTKLNELVKKSYGDSTNLAWDENITRNMRGYYAFSFWRYTHALHPMTPAIILETGFLTSAEDRKVIVSNPQLSAEGLASGIIQFLKEENLQP